MAIVKPVILQIRGAFPAPSPNPSTPEQPIPTPTPVEEKASVGPSAPTVVLRPCARPQRIRTGACTAAFGVGGPHPLRRGAQGRSDGKGSCSDHNPFPFGRHFGTRFRHKMTVNE